MAGKLPPETENPVPDAVSELIVNGAVPLEVTVTDFVTAVPTETFPNATDVLLHVSPGTAAFNCKAKFFDVEFELAVNVAVSAVLTEATVAVKDAVLDPEATVMLAGRVTAVALLDKLTLWPLDEAAPLNVTVHEVEPLPVKVLPEHDKAVTEGVMLDVVLALSLNEVLLEMDPCVAVRVAVCDAVTAATVAEKFALVAPEPTVIVAGTDTALLLLAKTIGNPPLGAAAVSVTVQDVDPFPLKELMAQLKALSEAVFETGALSEMVVFLETDPCFPVIVTDWEALTADTAASKLALLAPEATVTDTGTDTALLLLVRSTTNPALGAADVRLTVQRSLPAPVMEELAQLSPEREAVFEPEP